MQCWETNVEWEKRRHVQITIHYTSRVEAVAEGDIVQWISTSRGVHSADGSIARRGRERIREAVVSSS